MAHFALDPAHSSIEFTIRHMVFSKVRGAFTKFSVDLDVDDATNVPTRANAEIDAASVDTKVADRDNHLKSPDFFDVATYPAIAFRSTRITGSSAAIAIEGELTIHGVTKPVTLEAEFDGRGKDPWGNDRLAYSASAKINRKDFGLTWNQALETGGVLVGEDIDISLSIQAVKVQEAAAV